MHKRFLAIASLIAAILSFQSSIVALSSNVATGFPLVNFPTSESMSVATNPPALRIGPAGVVPAIQRGGSTDIDVQYDAAGGEQAMGFTVKFDPNALTLTNAVRGATAVAKGFTLILNQNRLANGEIGITLYNFGGATFDVSPPTNNIVRLTFTATQTAPVGITPIGFIGEGCPNNPGNAATGCSTAGLDQFGNPKAYSPTYSDGAINISSTAPANTRLEGDVNRDLANPVAGSGTRGTIDVFDLQGYSRYASGAYTFTTGPGSEFQALDDDPKATLGDGCVTIGDQQQIANYISTGSATWVVAGGKSAPDCTGGRPTAVTDTDRGTEPILTNRDPNASAVSHELKIAQVTAPQGSTVVIPITLDAMGDETAAQFSVRYDNQQLTFVSASQGNGVPAGAIFSASNNTDNGAIGVAMFSNSPFPSGLRTVINVTFTVSANPLFGTIPVIFGNSPTPKLLIGNSGTIPGVFTDGVITIGTPTVTVSGRVLTPEGSGLKSAAVSITDAGGNRRTVTTNSFGFYQITNVAGGTTYTLSATSKRYRFQSKSITPSDNLTGVDFTGLE